MTTIEERSAYLKNPYFEKPIYGDFSTFYVTIAVCSVFCLVIFVLNLVLGCCSKHRQYWQDRYTGMAIIKLKAKHPIIMYITILKNMLSILFVFIGNRWIVSLWTATPHQNPPLDLTELEGVSSFQPVSVRSTSIFYFQKYAELTCNFLLPFLG